MNQIKKWYIYQKERFPVLVYGLYVFCIVFATFCFFNYYWEMYYYEWIKLIPMFIVALLQFLMVRIVDEFKDYEEDCKYRPYRPVPRGLIKLKELKILFIICIIIQLILTITCSQNGLLYLIILWVFFALMSKGFFIKKILDKHLLLEVTLDELILPIMVLYLANFIPQIYSSTDFAITNSIIMADSNVWKILVMAYIISWIVEVARKIRCKEDEENGVKTYTAILGITKATILLFLLETLLMVVQGIILGQKNYIWIVALYILVNIPNILFIKKKTRKMAKLAELFANIYIAIVYCSLVILIL